MDISLFIGKRLMRIRGLAPWIEGSNRDRKCLPLYGGLSLEFEDLALILVSPLSYRNNQQGTPVLIGDEGSPSDLGVRAFFCSSAELRSMYLLLTADATEHWASLDPRLQTGDFIVSDFLGRTLIDVSAIENSLGVRKSRGLALQLSEGASLWLTYRQDLDGTIQFGAPGWNHQISRIDVDLPSQPFGWLLPEASIGVCIDNKLCRNAGESEWPWAWRKHLRAASPDAKTETYQHLLYLALRSRFDQHPKLLARLCAVQYPFGQIGTDGCTKALNELRLHFANIGPGLRRAAIWGA